MLQSCLDTLKTSTYALGLTIFGVNLSCGQEYPNRPIRIVSPGGNSDFTSRVISQALTTSLGWPVIVENRPGGIIPSEVVSKAPPDGYTLLVNGNLLWVAPLLEKTSFSALTDFAPISLLHIGPNILVVHPSLPVKSVKELIALAKAKPGELNYASGVTGAASQVAAELFKSMAGVKIVGVPYASPAQIVTDLMTGQVQLAFNNVPSVAPHLKSGRLKALGVASEKPSALFPELPTIAATVPGYQAELTTGIFAPAKTPAAIITRLNREIVRVLNTADVKEKFANAGVEIVGSTPEEMSNKIKSEIVRLTKVFKEIGIGLK